MSVEAEYRSKCAYCGNWIEEGDLIAKDADENWTHEECALDSKEATS